VSLIALVVGRPQGPLIHKKWPGPKARSRMAGKFSCFVSNTLKEHDGIVDAQELTRFRVRDPGVGG